MNQDQFNELTEKLLNACKDALGMKAGEYAREGDRLHNFYAAARKRNKHPLDSLLSMQVKHRVSIDDICDDIINHKKFPTDEMMLEKFKDDINYNLLAFALIHELREKARDKAKRGITVDISAVGANVLNEQIKKFRESLPDLGKISFSAIFQPHGTISRAEAEKMEWRHSAVKWGGDIYLPAKDSSDSGCIGCFFEENGPQCKLFLKDQKTDCLVPDSIIWLKVL